ncbi:hypothetical protein C5167_006311 [Papaver somniferum]|uniref:RNase H type-1 domain-containing protein n=1 Tax=Papaver somniferum TaxID=3469 RepID=A0A4Y7JH79_PAPSO|nr:hypothetical protein C5167_006311 [Papaver somniferum]
MEKGFLLCEGCRIIWYKANRQFGAARCWTAYADSIIDAEAQALSSAILWSSQIQLQKVIYVSDNLSLVNAINGATSSLHWTKFSLVHNCNVGLASLVASCCVFVNSKCLSETSTEKSCN